MFGKRSESKPGSSDDETSSQLSHEAQDLADGELLTLVEALEHEDAAHSLAAEMAKSKSFSNLDDAGDGGGGV